MTLSSNAGMSSAGPSTTPQRRKQPTRACKQQAEEPSCTISPVSLSVSSTGSAEEKLQRASLTDGAPWEDLLKYNGLNQHQIESALEYFRNLDAEEDPPLVFTWHHRDGRFLRAIRAYHQQHPNVPLPAYFPNLHPATTDEDLHLAILRECCVGAPDGAPAIRDSTIIECTPPNYAVVYGNCCELRHDQYLQAVAVAHPAAFPLAQIWTARPSNAHGTCVCITPRPARPPAAQLWG
jgi:hypothetical protein